MGEYDYRVTALRPTRAGLEVDGALGQWQTTMVLGPRDLARVALPAVAGAALLVALSRRR